MSDNYADIINLPHHVSKRHRQMPLTELSRRTKRLLSVMRSYKSAAACTSSLDEEEKLPRLKLPCACCGTLRP